MNLIENLKPSKKKTFTLHIKILQSKSKVFNQKQGRKRRKLNWIKTLKTKKLLNSAYCFIELLDTIKSGPITNDRSLLSYQKPAKKMGDIAYLLL